MSSLSSPSSLPSRYAGDLSGEESELDVPLRRREGRGNQGVEPPLAQDLSGSSRVRSDRGQAERPAY